MLQLGKKKDPALVGLEIEAGGIAAAEMPPEGGTQPSATAFAPLPPGAFRDGEVVDAEIVAEALRSLFAEQKLSRRVRLGIANQRVVVRTMRLPALDDPKELESAVRFQAQEQIPMPIDQAVLDYRVVGGAPPSEGAGPQIDIVVVAARRDMIEATLEPLRAADLEPVGVDLSVFGLIRALSTVAPVPDDEGAPASNTNTTLYCNVGDVTNLAIAKGRSCLFTRVSPSGLEGVAANLCAATGLSDEHARLWLAHVGLTEPVETIEGDPATTASARTALESGVAAVLDEVRLSLDFYAAQEAAVPVEQVVLSGPGSAIPGFAEGMQSVLGLPIEVGCPEALAGLDPVSAARLTTAYGLSLDS